MIGLPALVVAVATMAAEPTDESIGWSGRTIVGFDHPAAVVGSANGSNWFVVEQGKHRVVRLHAGGVAVVAGNDKPGFAGDGGPGESAQLNKPSDLLPVNDSILYISDAGNHVIRRVDLPTGVIERVAGTGEPGFAGDGGDPLLAQLQNPTGMAIDEIGRLYVADTGNQRIRRIDFTKRVIETVLGNGERGRPVSGKAGAGQPLTEPRSLTMHDRFLWFTLRGGNSVYRWRLGSKLFHVAGTGEAARGLTAAANDTPLSGPEGIAVGADGRVYVADTGNNRLLRIDASTGSIAEAATGLKTPMGLCVAGPLGPVKVAEFNGGRIVEAGEVLEDGTGYALNYQRYYRQLDRPQFTDGRPYFGTVPNPYDASYYGPYYHGPNPITYYGVDLRPRRHWGPWPPPGTKDVPAFEGFYRGPYYGPSYYPGLYYGRPYRYYFGRPPRSAAFP